jgi:LysM repeat protein
METGLEMKILKLLAVVALIVAAVIGLFIVSESGIIGGKTANSGGNANEAPADTGRTTQAEPEPANSTFSDEDQATGTQTATTAYEEYTVKENDSFATIAAAHNTTIAEIQELNPDANSNNLHVGDTLKLPVTSP